MILYEGQKYACINCIRGHRSSTCGHRDRPLLQVRRRGRPVADGATRLAILNQNPCQCLAREQECKCEHSGECVVVRTIDCTPSADKGITKRTLKLRTAKKASRLVQQDFDAEKGELDASLKEEDEEDDQKVFAGEFVFVPVGGGLYRKEPAADHKPPTSQCSGSKPTISCCSKSIPKNLSASKSCCGGERSDMHSANSVEVSASPRSDAASEEDPLATPEAYRDFSRESSHHAPALIAPMYFNGHDPAELGFTQEEAAELWGNDGEFDFAAMCVMPGHCQCGDDCTCENCYTHGRGAFRGKNSML